jgi:RNA polymerase sigma-70 factor (ECF subfamily)
VDERTYLAAAAQGDRDAFSELVRLHQSRLRGMVALTVRDRDDVLDIVQESFVDAWRGLEHFDLTREFGPWLRTICRNRLAKYMRDHVAKRSHAVALVDSVLQHERFATSVNEGDDKRLFALRRCLEHLDHDHRELVRQRYAEGVAVTELAQQLGKSPNAISMMLIRIKAILQRCVAGGAVS